MATQVRETTTGNADFDAVTWFIEGEGFSKVGSKLFFYMSQREWSSQEWKGKIWEYKFIFYINLNY